jgi:hypothetical protein
MEFDELKSAWRALETRIDAEHALNAQVFTELKLERARSALRPLWWLLSTQLAIALSAVVLLGTFLADYWQVPRFAVPAILLDIAVVMLIGSTAGQLRVLSTIDYGQAVVTIQSMLTELAVRRAREVRWQWLLMLPLWTPFAIVVMQGIFGVDIYRVFGARWMVVNVAFGIVLTPLVVWWARRFDARQDGIAKGLADDIAGRRLSDAMRRLDEIGAFESEV